MGLIKACGNNKHNWGFETTLGYQGIMLLHLPQKHCLC